MNENSNQDERMPPMVPYSHKNQKRRTRPNNTKRSNAQNWKSQYKPRRLDELHGPDHLLASQLPQGFPPELAFRALAAYSLMRTLSCELRLSPFTPNVFLRALHLPFPSRLMGQVHVALLRVLLPALQMGYSYKAKGGYVSVSKRRKLDGLRWLLRGGDNLTYLDTYTWPVFFDDYVHLTADVLFEKVYNTDSFVDFRTMAMQHIERNDSNNEKSPSKEGVEGARRAAPSFLSRGRRPVSKALPRKVKLEDDEEDDSDASIHESESDDEDFTGPRTKKRKKHGGKRGRPRKGPQIRSAAPSLLTRPRGLPMHTPASSLLKRPGGVPIQKAAPYLLTRPGGLPMQNAAPQLLNRPGGLPFHAQPLGPPPNAGLINNLTSKRPLIETATVQAKKPKLSPVGPSLHSMPRPKVNATTQPPAPLQPQIPPVPKQQFQPQVMAQPMRSSGAMLIPGMDPRLAMLPGMTPAMIASLMRSGVNPMFGFQSFMHNTPRPGVPSLPRPVMPYTHQMVHQQRPFLPQPRKPIKVKAPPVPKIKVQKARERGGLGVSDDVADAVQGYLRRATGPKPNANENSSSEGSRPLLKNLAMGATATKQATSGVATTTSVAKASEAVDIDVRIANTESVSKEQSLAKIMLKQSSGALRPANSSASLEKESSVSTATTVPDEKPGAKSITSQKTELSLEKAEEPTIVYQQHPTIGSTPTSSALTASDGKASDAVRIDGKSNPSSTKTPTLANRPTSDTMIPSTSSSASSEKESSTGASMARQVPDRKLGVDSSLNQTTLESLSEAEGSTKQNPGGLPNNGDRNVTSTSLETELPTMPSSKDANHVPPCKTNMSAKNGAGDANIKHAGNVVTTERPVNALKSSLKCNAAVTSNQDQSVSSQPKEKLQDGVKITLKSVINSTKVQPVPSNPIHLGAVTSSNPAGLIANQIKTPTPPQSASYSKPLVGESATISSLKGVLNSVPRTFTSKETGTAKTLPIPGPSGGVLSSEKESTVSPGLTTEIKPETKPQNFVDEWPQFKPVQTMRNGTPYHRLSVEKKLDILEFLIDELLTVDYIAAEFTRRHLTNECFTNKFAALPSKEELENLDNADECAVCALEGDLLCCDGCPRSFHRKCIGMSEHADLGEGEWLCPECLVVDPAKFGSLRGGSKASVDWFSFGDVIESNKRKSSLFNPATASVAAVVPDNVDGGETGGQPSQVNKYCNSGSNQSVGTGSELGSLPMDMSSGLPSSLGTSIASIQSNSTLMKTEYFDSREFLLIHGFLFSRPGADTDVKAVDYNENFESYKAASRSRLLCTKQDIFKTWSRAGSDICSKWPLVQVPLITTKVWGGTHSQQHQSIFRFFSNIGRIDPSRYESQYRKAPLPKALRATRQFQLVLSDFETECSPVDTRYLSSQMVADMSSDKSLWNALQFNKLLFNPYKMIADYMEKIESVLHKARLLNESWGLKSKNFREDTWSRNVRGSESVSRLSRLLVDLVDAAHPIAFSEEWFQPAGGRKASPDDSGDAKNLFPISKDWSEQLEKKKRKWDRCTISTLRSLLASEGKQLDSVLEGAPIRLHRSGKRKKRKTTKTIMQHVTQDHVVQKKPVIPERVSEVAKENFGQPALSDTFQASEVSKNDDSILAKQKIFSSSKEEAIKSDGAPESKVDGANPLKTATPPNAEFAEKERHLGLKNKKSKDSNRPRRSRRSRGDGDGNGAINTYQSAVENFQSFVEDVREQKIHQIVNDTVPLFTKERNWPVAGRKLFDPPGNLPPAEVKRLGRNAGSFHAPFFTYTDNFEVGQPSVYHIWRKQGVCCNSFEQLIMQIRVLDSYFNKEIIPTCEAAGRRYGRGTTAPAKVVACSLRDISTGQLQYFVLNKNKGRGAWFPCNKVDAAAYIVERGRREAKLREGWSKRKAVHNQIIRERQAKELAARRAKEEVLRKIAAEKAAALAKERKKSILAEQAAKQEQRKQAVEKLKVQFKDVLTSHETQVGGLLTSCTKLKLRAIPEPKMNGIRLSTLRKLKELNKQVHKYGGSPFSKTDLTKLLSEAESRAQSKFTIENAARLEAEKKEAAKRIAAKKEAEKRAMASKLQQLYSQQQSTGRNSASSSSLSSFSQSSAQFSRPPSSQYSRPQSSSSTAMMQGSLDPNTMNAMLQQMKGTVVHSQAVPPAHPTAQMVHRPSSNASSLSFGSTQASHSSSLSSAGGGGNAQQFGSQSQQGAFHPHAYQITSEPSKVNSQQHGVAIGAANTASNDMMHLLRTMRPSSQYANGAGNMQQMASQLLHQQRPSEPNNNYRQQMNLAQQAQGYQSHPTQFQYGQQNNHVQMPASYGQAQNFHQFNSMAGQLSQQHQQHQAQQFGLQQSLPSHGGLSNQLQSQLQQQYGMQPIRQRQQQQQQQNQFGVDFEPSPVDNISYGNADRYQQANNNNNVPGRNQNNQWM